MTRSLDDVALFRAYPSLARSERLPWVRLGEWPTPVERCAALDGDAGGEVWIKRDDRSATAYGGSKVRTLEALLGAARAGGARVMWATGALGSNHVLATIFHAPTAGLEPAAILFPQPTSTCARDNLTAILGSGTRVRLLRTWATLPWAMRTARSEDASFVMPPGGATPLGALGHVSAALEIAQQIRAGELPPPRRVIVGAGSCCTAAGLLVGFAVAARLGLGFDPASLPEVWAVRVSPWPVASRTRILSLAVCASTLLAALVLDPRLAMSRGELGRPLRVVGGYLGRGYGHVTRSGLAAIARFSAVGGPPLDTCYSGKIAAALLGRPAPGPALFWATKSSQPLPQAPPELGPPPQERLARWLAAGAATLPTVP